MKKYIAIFAFAALAASCATTSTDNGCPTDSTCVDTTCADTTVVVNPNDTVVVPDTIAPQQ